VNISFLKIWPVIATLGALALCGDAAETARVPEAGAQRQILVVEKNVHPENLMVVYTKVDADGHFVPDPDRPSQPMLDFYWLMDGKKFKPVNPLIKSEIRKRLAIRPDSTDGPTRFAVNVNDLKEVACDIEQPKMDIYVNGSGNDRDVEAQMNLGPSDGNMRIKVSSIYTEGRAFPPAVYSVTLKGEEIVNGKVSAKKIVRKYYAKDR
jgi:hypothetical protein